METSKRIAEILKALDDGVIGRSEVYIHVGIALVDFGCTRDVKELPLWIKQELVEWAQEFEETKHWGFISSVGERDLTAEGFELLSLLKESGIMK